MLDGDWESTCDKDGTLELELGDLDTIASGELADDEDDKIMIFPQYHTDSTQHEALSESRDIKSNSPSALKCGGRIELADEQNVIHHRKYDENDLLDAVDSGDPYAVHNVLSSGEFYVDQGDLETNITPLIRAVRSNNICIALMLLSKGASSLESSTNGNNAIFYAAQTENYIILNWLYLVQTGHINSIDYCLGYDNNFYFTINYSHDWFLQQRISYRPVAYPQ